MRNQFHHVIDIAPTIYELLKIPHPAVVHGNKQIPIDGVSLAYTFDDASTPTKKKIQFFDNNGSRAIYKDGWMACAFGPFIPWNTPASISHIQNWDSATDQWELYNLNDDFSQADDLSKTHPDKLNQLKNEFLELAKKTRISQLVRAIGCGFILKIESPLPTPIGTSVKTHDECLNLPRQA